jgi:hypothetical protein
LYDFAEARGLVTAQPAATESSTDD